MLTKLTHAISRYSIAFVLTISTIVGLGASHGSWTTPVDHATEQLRNTVAARKASGNIVVVAVDSDSLDDLSEWPWPRRTHGKLIDKLMAAGATNVALDITFKTKSADPQDDRLLAAALRRANGRVTLPATRETDDNWNTVSEILPTPELRSQAAMGSIWVRLDDDNLIRRSPYTIPLDGKAVPELGVALSLAPASTSGSFPINWSIDPSSFPSISYSKVLRGDFPKGFFAGKSVIVGTTAQTFSDFVYVPTHGHIPGLYVQATAAETLRLGAPFEISAFTALIMTLALIALSLLARSAPLRFLALTGIFALTLGVPVALLQFLNTFSVSSAPILAVLAAMAAQGFIEAICSMHRRLTQDPDTGLPNLQAMRLARLKPGSTIAVQLRNHTEATAILGNAAYADLLKRARERIVLAAGNAVIYQVAPDSFAWRSQVESLDLNDSLEALNAIFMSGIEVGGRIIDTNVAIGLSNNPTDTLDSAVTTALAAAERAARRAIPWEIYEADDDDARWRLSLLAELDRAISKGDLWVAYQPKICLRDGSVIGAEALVRWNHTERGPIRPDHFIPIVEQAGRIDRLTAFVLETAIRDFAALGGDTSVAVNISPKMLGRGKLEGPITALLEKHGMPPSRLTLEVTESADLTDQVGIAELERLRALGVSISIDDYGTGQSTLSYFKRLPATELKIDRSFIQLILTNRSDSALVKSTIHLAHELNLKVVAEGVETQDVLDALKAMDCDIIQGYHTGRPVSLADFRRDYDPERGTEAA